MFAKIRFKLEGWKTIIWARALVLIGIIVTILSVMTGDQVSALLPDRYKPFAPMVLALVGIITEALRRVTTGPVGSKGDQPATSDTKAGD
jgi:hypothetical protein